jgi:hypothetical protein
MVTKNLLILLLVVGVTLARPQYVDPGLAVSEKPLFLILVVFEIVGPIPRSPPTYSEP